MTIGYDNKPRHEWGSLRPKIGDIVVSIGNWDGEPRLYTGRKYTVEKRDGYHILVRPIEDKDKRESIYMWDLDHFKPSEDACGNCTSRCRRIEGKCSLYSEEV